MPPVLWVEWIDPEPFPRGLPVRGGYVETFWTPLLGPTSMALARRLAYRLSAGAAAAEGREQPFLGFDANLVALAAEVGVGPDTGWNRLKALVRFGFAERDGRTFRLAAHWPLVGEDDVERLPPSLRRFARPPAPERVA